MIQDKPTAPSRPRLLPGLLAWAVLAAAVAAGGGDAMHYWALVGGLIVTAALAYFAHRQGRPRLCEILVLAPPLVVAGAIGLFMLRLVLGFFA